MTASFEPTEALLAAIRRSNVKLGKQAVTGATGATAPRPPQPVRNDPIAEMLGSSKR
jgi:hypothetical protein